MSDLDGSRLSHIDEHGRAVMVDVTGKDSTERHAEARCRIIGISDPAALFAGQPDLFTEARVAGLRAAKATSDLIPLCHPLALTHLSVDFAVSPAEVEVRAVAETTGQTGVEMEALTACTVAGLSLLGRARRRSPRAGIDEVALYEKRGGRSGTWLRTAQDVEADDHR